MRVLELFVVLQVTTSLLVFGVPVLHRQKRHHIYNSHLPLNKHRRPLKQVVWINEDDPQIVDIEHIPATTPIDDSWWLTDTFRPVTTWWDKQRFGDELDKLWGVVDNLWSDVPWPSWMRFNEDNYKTQLVPTSPPLTHSLPSFGWNSWRSSRKWDVVDDTWLSNLYTSCFGSGGEKEKEEENVVSNVEDEVITENPVEESETTTKDSTRSTLMDKLWSVGSGGLYDF